MKILFQNKMFRIEAADIAQDNIGHYKTKYFVDYLNGSNDRNFDTLEEAIAYANTKAYCN